jgi:hypothetical protein
MKPAKEEIFRVRFGNILQDGNTVYFILTIGEEGMIYHFVMKPVKITLVGGKVIITNEDKTKLVIKYSNEVELFYRPIEKKDDGKNRSNKSIS